MQITTYSASARPATPETEQFTPLEQINKPNVDTAHAAYLLTRRPQTLRGWACLENGPLRPLRIMGRLAWPTAAIKQLLGVA